MAHPDLDDLLNMLLPFAKQMLAEHGEFHPFAGMTRVSGEGVHVGGDTGSEMPRAQEVIDVLVAGLREDAERGEIRAAAVCLDMRVVPPGGTERSDAICLRLDHSEGEAVDVFVPYRKVADEFEYGALFAAAGQLAVFDAAEGPHS